MRQHVRMIRFSVLHPGRAAGSKVRERVLGHFIDFWAAFAEDPVLNLLDEFRPFFNDRLVCCAVAVVYNKAHLFESIDKLFGRKFAGFTAKLFTDGHANSGRRMRNHNAVWIIKHAFDFVDEAHLFDSAERAGNQTLPAVNAGVIDDFMLGAEASLDGIGRAELTAGVAADALVLIDMNNAAQFPLSEVAFIGGTTFPMGISARQECSDLDRMGH